jgi:trehalose 6-phosphate phosphatase
MGKARPPPPWRDDWALFLDVDGTLVEIAATPAAVRVPPRLIPTLTSLRDRLGGAIALVSGRDLADLDRLVAPLQLPAAGAHGAERRSATGAVHVKPVADSLAPAEAFLVRFVAAHKGALLERKQGSVALHYRNVPWLEPAAQVVTAAAAAAVGPEFHVQPGKKVLEIKAASVGKGRAIAEFMAEPPFAGRVPVFVGDDRTDEDGFDVVNALGGHSIAVGTARGTRARWRFADENHVLNWLETETRPGGATQ